MSRISSPLQDRVAFLVGVRRSGTNWLRRIVDAHPDAAVIPGETYLLSHGIAPLRERVQHGLAGSARTGTMFVDRDEFLDAVRQLCDRLLGAHLRTLDRPVRVLAERTPDHVRVLDLIADVYPDAAVVHIIRDGRDVVRSLVSQSWGPADHAAAAREWVSGIETARRHAPRLDRYLEVSYEDLLADPVSQVPALYRFLGLDDDPAVVRAALAEAQVPYNVDPAAASVRAGKWREELRAEDLEEVLDVAGPLLAELGYDVSVRAAGAAQRAERPLAAGFRRAAEVAAGVAGRIPAVRFEREVLSRFDTSMAVLDGLLADVAARRFDDLERHFGPSPRVRVVDGRRSWDERGPSAVARLAATWATDPALRGRPCRGDVHPGAPTFVVVGTWMTDGGATYDRVLAVASYGDRIDELTWYVLPREVRPGADDGADGPVVAGTTPHRTA